MWSAPRTPMKNHGVERRRNVVKRHAKLKKKDVVQVKYINGRNGNAVVIAKVTQPPQFLVNRFPGQNIWKVRNMNTHRISMIPFSHVLHVNANNGINFYY